MKNLFFNFSFVYIFLSGIHVFAQEIRVTYLSDMDYSLMVSGWRTAKANLSVTGKPLSIGNIPYKKGLGTNSNSEMMFVHDGSPGKFLAVVGVDDSAPNGTVEFFVLTDRGVVFESGLMRSGNPGIPVEVDLRKVKKLCLIVSATKDGNRSDYANWADARFEAKKTPVPVDLLTIKEKPYILTPPVPAYPQINGSKIYGVTPGKPFVFRVATTGVRPITFTVEGLPESLHINADGIISGTSPERGEYKVAITAKNEFGQCSDTLKIISGDKLALTPHMGWNSWYIHAGRVTQKDMENAAKAMVQNGMANYGYCYVNIDAGWAKSPGKPNDPIYGVPMRAEDGTILCNKKFPDIRAFTGLVHSLGLKTGIYSSPSDITCADFVGAYGHEAQDAKTFSDWGFDFLKYDWCTYGNMPETRDKNYFRKPYELMGRLLKEQSRDMVFNICQYGRDNVWEWGREVGGHSWRTHGDIGHGNLAANMFSMGLSLGILNEYAGPGGWNDPDYLLFGEIMDNPDMDDASDETGKIIPTALSPSEQYTYMTIWSMAGVPLIFSGKITNVDAFTLNVLCNAEVIAVNQDELGKSGYCIYREQLVEIWEKPLSDGSFAVAIFNCRPTEDTIKINWNELGYGNASAIRDLWIQQDIKNIKKISELQLPRHGCSMYRMKK